MLDNRLPTTPSVLYCGASWRRSIPHAYGSSALCDITKELILCVFGTRSLKSGKNQKSKSLARGIMRNQKFINYFFFIMRDPQQDSGLIINLDGSPSHRVSLFFFSSPPDVRKKCPLLSPALCVCPHTWNVPGCSWKTLTPSRYAVLPGNAVCVQTHTHTHRAETNEPELLLLMSHVSTAN